ncbi:hypothetical protein MTO96_039751 [Rhipicephalus appendiculatus]
MACIEQAVVYVNKLTRACRLLAAAVCSRGHVISFSSAGPTAQAQRRRSRPSRYTSAELEDSGSERKRRRTRQRAGDRGRSNLRSPSLPQGRLLNRLRGPAADRNCQPCRAPRCTSPGRTSLPNPMAKLRQHCEVTNWDKEEPVNYDVLVENVRGKDALLCMLTDKIDKNLSGPKSSRFEHLGLSNETGGFGVVTGNVLHRELLAEQRHRFKKCPAVLS